MSYMFENLILGQTKLSNSYIILKPNNMHLIFFSIKNRIIYIYTENHKLEIIIRI